MGDSEEFNETIVPDILSPIVFDYLYHPKIVITLQASRPLADDTMIDDEIASLKAFFELPEVSEFYISQGSKKDKKEYYHYEVKHKVQISTYRRTISISFVIENVESLEHGGVQIKDFSVWEIEKRLKDHNFKIYWESKFEDWEDFHPNYKTFKSFVDSAEKSTISFRDREQQLSHPSVESLLGGGDADGNDGDDWQEVCSTFFVYFKDTAHDRSPDSF
eukprot:874964_1